MGSLSEGTYFEEEDFTARILQLHVKFKFCCAIRFHLNLFHSVDFLNILKDKKIKSGHFSYCI